MRIDKLKHIVEEAKEVLEEAVKNSEYDIVLSITNIIGLINRVIFYDECQMKQKEKRK